ncbi:MAG: glycosyltransferase [Deltaproteobacteria bacterium]|jgi:glycosyltransferase|nr:glycosyltransferase [Deltaproteobacteria bacterium]
MNSPLISILSAFKNDIKMLKLVMDSVLEQNYPKVEHVIIDGESTDGSVDLLKEYESKYFLKGYLLVWKSEKDNNSSEAYNKAAGIASGAYFIQFTNLFVSDNSLKTIVDLLVNGGYHGVAGGYIYLRNGRIIRRWSGKQLPWRLGWMAATETFLISRTVLEKYEIADPAFKRSSDYNFQLSLFLDPKIIVKSFNIPITLFISGGESNGGFMNNLKSIYWDYIALRNHKVKFAFFTSFCKCIHAFFGYLLAPRTIISSKHINKLN